MKDNEETAVVEDEEIPANEELDQEENQSTQPEDTGETPESTEKEAADDGDSTEEEPEELGVDIVIDGETPPQEEKDEFAGQPAPQWAKDLRKKNRELEKRIRESDRQNKQEVEKQEQIVLGPRPTLYDDGIDGDDDKLAVANDAYYERKGKIDSSNRKQTDLKKQDDDRMKEVQTSYVDKKKAFSDLVPDYEEAEQAIEQAFDSTQQGILLTGATNLATMAYTLYKRPSLLKEMSKIKDPVKFAIALGELQTKAKINPRKPSTRPEKTVAGHNKQNSGVTAQMAKLEKEYDKTGDRTKINALKREQRELARKQ